MSDFNAAVDCVISSTRLSSDSRLMSVTILSENQTAIKNINTKTQKNTETSHQYIYTVNGKKEPFYF